MSQERTTPLGATNIAGWLPHTDRERDAVRVQMERLLSHDLFKHSRRYPTLLRYVVEHALENDMDRLKERRLGIEVFGREADYDTNLDPVVRITAGEIRKRIAQYYHEAGHQEELRIDLPVGSYVPEFQPPTETRTLDSVRPSRHRWVAAAITTVAFFAVLAGLAWTRPWASRSALEQFWDPVLASSSPVLLCVGRAGPQVDDRSTPAIQSDAFWMPSHTVALSDAMTLSRLAGLLHSESSRYHIQGSEFTTLSHLRDGPVILIGAFNNQWTLKLASPLRYTFEKSSTRDVSWIQDRLHPERRDWVSDFSSPTWRTPRTTRSSLACSTPPPSAWW